MGVTIHYRGTVDKSRVPEITSLIKDFAEAAAWDYWLVDEEIGPICSGDVTTGLDGEVEICDPFGRGVTRENRGLFYVKERVCGIEVSLHEECETFSLVWNVSRYPDRAYLARYFRNRSGNWWHENPCFTKTQFAPLRCHTTICKLLWLLRDRFGVELLVFDEGGYYDTGDLDLLAKNLDENRAAIDKLARIFESMGLDFAIGPAIRGDAE